MGLFIGVYILLWLASYAYDRRWFRQQPRIARLAGYFLKELVVANIKVTYEVLTPNNRLSPAVISVPVDLDSDGEITLLANMITLTPGTLTIDISEDRRFLYVHALYTDSGVEDFRRTIKEGFEARIKAVSQTAI